MKIKHLAVVCAVALSCLANQDDIEKALVSRDVTKLQATLEKAKQDPAKYGIEQTDSGHQFRSTPGQSSYEEILNAMKLVEQATGKHETGTKKKVTISEGITKTVVGFGGAVFIGAFALQKGSLTGSDVTGLISGIGMGASGVEDLVTAYKIKSSKRRLNEIEMMSQAMKAALSEVALRNVDNLDDLEKGKP